MLREFLAGFVVLVVDDGIGFACRAKDTKNLVLLRLQLLPRDDYDASVLRVLGRGNGGKVVVLYVVVVLGLPF